MLKIIKIILLSIWNVWFYVLAFIGILTTFPLLILFSSSERFYPQFYWVARNIWSNIILFGMGFWPVVENKKKLEKGISSRIYRDSIMENLTFVENQTVIEIMTTSKKAKSTIKSEFLRTQK